jgi:hypothetical protein
MPKFARYKRVLQFEAGPNEHTFYACVDHKLGLTDHNEMPNCFFGLDKDKIDFVDEDDEIDCWFCQEP